MIYATIEEAIAAVRRGEFIIVVDDADREDEGDLIIAAEKVTPEKLAFMVRYTSGLVCVPVVGDRLDALELPLMVSDNTDSHHTAFTVSVDYGPGTTTGISAADRSATIHALIDDATGPEDLARPGHIFPLRYRDGGVLVRPGHTEASVDFARLAGLYPAAALCEVVNEDGSMARGQDLVRFAKEHDLLLVTIADLVSYLGGRDGYIERVAEARLPTDFGEFRVLGYRSRLDDSEHAALVMGDVAGRDDVLVRAHSECLTGDALGSLRCDCRSQLLDAQRRVAAEGRGVVLYIRGHEGRGIGLTGKIAAYALQDAGRDTVQANEDLGLPVDSRDYGVVARILNDLSIDGIRLLTNNPAKQSGLEGYGVNVVERVPLQTTPTEENHGYLETKAAKLGHQLDG